MYVAKMETQNFTFTALGESETDALDALARGWDAHAGEYRVSMDAQTALEEYGAACVAIPVGRCTRDNELL
jgi:hypothetical protein